MISENNKKHDDAANIHYDKLFGKQFDEEVDQLKADVINDMNTYEEYIPNAMCNVTIDNISVSCDDVFIAAKVAASMRLNNVDTDTFDEFDYENIITCINKIRGDDE